MSRPWVFGNTTIRNPQRMHDALAALGEHPEACPRKGREYENAFARFLNGQSIVKIERSEADVSDLGRKWRSGLVKLGYLYPELSESPFALTPAGRRLAGASSANARQECFLRALANTQIPSVIEPDYDCEVFNPFRLVVAVALALEEATGDTTINFVEMAGILQFANAASAVDEVCRQILDFRDKRAHGEGSKRSYDGAFLKAEAARHGYRPKTPHDYADANLRYLKATGLFCSAGRGIRIVGHRRTLATLLARHPFVAPSDGEYVERLTAGGPLPTDDREAAALQLSALCGELRRRGLPVPVAWSNPRDIADIRAASTEADELLARELEREFASKQAESWQEIVAYMRALGTTSRRQRDGHGGDVAPVVEIPDSEYPAYLEWTIWRAFLAINSLVCRPHEARRFEVDVDFLPVGTAPGNGPDMCFEFDDFFLVVEVTLTSGSRQEACEGESVRRHVADTCAARTKPVFGLFVAPRVDTNTVETFRHGSWYLGDDRHLDLSIVPVSLSSFAKFFGGLFSAGKPDAMAVRRLIEECVSWRKSATSPEWRTLIEDTCAIAATSAATNHLSEGVASHAHARRD